MELIRIHMLGEFSIRCGDNVISDSENRSRKVWHLLAYLIYNRDRGISQKKLIDLLWGEDSMSSNPENAMRITMHRARGLLDQLYEGAGRELIVRRDGGYGWNPDAECELDCDRFLQLAKSTSDDDEAHLNDMLEALSLYNGPFLPRLASEMWAIPVGTHFQAQFLTTTLEASDMLSARGRYEEAMQLCQNALSAEPYHEPLYQRLMQAMVSMGDVQGATGVFERLSKRLADDFDIQPSEETRSLYRNLTLAPKNMMPVEEVLEDIHERQRLSGAMMCEYEYFKVLCFAKSRAMERDGEITHVALLNLSSESDPTRSGEDFSKTMEQLGAQLQANLRRGDIISRCSVSQYIIMLPKANYENSCMVCRRIIAAFLQKHPIAGDRINFIVQPLTTGMSVP